VLNEPADFVLYDAECPVCSRYVAWTRLKEVCPHMALLNARERPVLVAKLRSEGIEINNSMVVRLGDMTLYGHQAFSSYYPGCTG
jgi:hypothetical protein